jgi:hypothetical protein
MLLTKATSVAEYALARGPEIGSPWFRMGQHLSRSSMSEDDQYPKKEIAERMERVVRRFLNMPPQPHGRNPKSPPAKPKERPASKGRVHKAKSRS